MGRGNPAPSFLEIRRMSWKHSYLKRAQRLAATPVTSPDFQRDWNSLEDDILGKLALWQAADLYDFVAAIPGQGSMVIISMMPDDLPHGE
jgi:hypothetical protein